MKIPNPTTAGPEAPDQRASRPGLPTWPRVYLLVAASFILWVILLRLLSVLFA